MRRRLHRILVCHRDRLRATVAVRRREPTGVRGHRRWRNSPAGIGDSGPADLGPQAQLAGARAAGGGGVMSHRAIYWSIAGVLAVLLVAALATWHYNKASAEAIAKANQLISSYES